MKRKIELLMAILTMTIGMSACGQANSQETSEPVASIETMTVNSFEIEITSVPFAKYQVDLLAKNDYYIDGLEEDDSPAFVFIGPAGKSIYREVVDIQADDSQNVTITVCETKSIIKDSGRYPITRVMIYPFPASVTVVDENGKPLKCE